MTWRKVLTTLQKIRQNIARNAEPYKEWNYPVQHHCPPCFRCWIMYVEEHPDEGVDADQEGYVILMYE